jgi:hypothetical protein
MRRIIVACVFLFGLMAQAEAAPEIGQNAYTALSSLKNPGIDDASNAHYQSILSGSYREIAGVLAKQGDVKGSLDALAKSASPR